MTTEVYRRRLHAAKVLRAAFALSPVPGVGVARALLGVTIIVLSTAPQTALAAWPQFGRAVCAAAKSQVHSEITTDGAGGAIITWQDPRFRRVNVFAQHVFASGEVDPAWPADGRALLGDSLALATADGGQIFPLIVSDGAGGAIVVWQDLRSEPTAIDLFAQHVLASGDLDAAWPANGTPLCVIEGLQVQPAVIPDGEGGAIVTWMDGRPGASATDIYAQHILASGFVDPGWPVNGAAVCSAPGSQESPVIVSDGGCGAILAWTDVRTGEFDVFAQHMLASGAADPAWPANGRAVSAAPGSQGNPTIVTDGAHGAIVAWTDGRSTDENHIFAQHVLASGQVDPAWPLDGRAISSAADIESRAFAVSDGAGGAVVTWQGFTVDLNQLSMYAQHVTPAGLVDPVWPASGRKLTTSELQQTKGVIATDGAGGAIIAWEENFDIVAQHVLASGSLDPTYPGTGLPVCNLSSGQGDPSIVATGGAGAIVAWSDTRNGAGTDIFALQVLEAETSAVPDPPPVGFTFTNPTPNPARGPFTLTFTLPGQETVRLAIYDTAGRRVRELVSGTKAAGEHRIAWDQRDDHGDVVSAGIYFARLDAGQRAVTRKLLSLK